VFSGLLLSAERHGAPGGESEPRWHPALLHSPAVRLHNCIVTFHRLSHTAFQAHCSQGAMLCGMHAPPALRDAERRCKQCTLHAGAQARPSAAAARARCRLRSLRRRACTRGRCQQMPAAACGSHQAMTAPRLTGRRVWGSSRHSWLPAATASTPPQVCVLPFHSRRRCHALCGCMCMLLAHRCSNTGTTPCGIPSAAPANPSRSSVPTLCHWLSERRLACCSVR
jgi:hypothetical protein